MKFFRKRKTHPQKPIEFGDFKTGDVDPTTGCYIINIVFQTDRFIVTIDEDYNLNWFASEEMNFAPDFGQVVSEVNLSEALVDRIFEGRNKFAYKKILGEALARLLDECNAVSAKIVVVEAKQRILEHCKVKVKMAYIYSAVRAVVFAGIGVLLSVLFRKELIEAVGSVDIYRMMSCTFLGGIGAFITTFARFQNYEGSIVSGLSIHRLDGFLRIFYGFISGIIISLAIKGNLLAGFASDDKHPWVMYFFAMVAGASEVLIPNLVKQAESQVIYQKPEIVKPVVAETNTAVPPDQILPITKDISLHAMSVKPGVPDDEVLSTASALLQ